MAKKLQRRACNLRQLLEFVPSPAKAQAAADPEASTPKAACVGRLGPSPGREAAGAGRGAGAGDEEAPEDEVILRHQTTVFPAEPQRVDGHEVWPEHWGMTKEQIRDLLARLRAEPSWRPENNVYTLVSDYIIPWTKGTGISYAVSLNREHPEEVNVMVSHAWGENAEDFLAALIRSSSKSDVFFICAFSIYQPEDGAGPSIAEQLGSDPRESPFQRVLEHLQARGREAGWRWRRGRWLKAVPDFCIVIGVILFYLPCLLWNCVPTISFCAVLEEDGGKISSWERAANQIFGPGTSWLWIDLPPGFQACVVLGIALFVAGLSTKWVRHRLHVYNGRMVAVPNRQVDIYSRLWCVYEIFVAKNLGVPVEMARTMAWAGSVSSRQASCSSPEDAARICKMIENGPFGYSHIDKAVFLTTRRARFEAAQTVTTHGLRISVTNVAFFCISGPTPHAGFDILGMLLALSLVIALLQCIFMRAQGTPSFSSVLACCLFLEVFGVSLLCCHEVWPSLAQRGCVSFAWALTTSGLQTMIFLLAGVCCCRWPCLKVHGRHPVLVLLSAVIFAILTALDMRQISTWDQLYPDVIQNVSFVAGYFWAPAYVWWSAALHWGVRIGERRR